MGVASASTDEPRSEARSLPITFSIVGVQKGATSTLYGMLGSHRRIARGPAKERHFFDDESRTWDPPDYSDYHTPTTKPRIRIAGDATPIYLFWPNALERMHAYNPEMLLIASFRDPIERAFSQWSMERGRKVPLPDFGAAIEDERFNAVPEAMPSGQGVRRGGLRTRTLVGRGLYGQQLRRGFELFGDRAQWLLLDFREFLGEPKATLDRVTDFLGIERYRSYPELQKRNASPDNHTGVPPTGDDIARLAEFYADDLAEFTELSSLDTSSWATRRILAGDLDPAELAEKLSRRAGLIG
ncbi:MAG: hypothetical protein ACRDO7_00385 [Nocardioidaceae bacterium]